MIKRKKLYLAAPIRLYKPPTVKQSILYYIRLCFADGLVLYKIGYTSMTIVDRVEGYFDKKLGRQVGGMGLPCGCSYRIISVVYKGSKTSAYAEEQRLHKLYVNARYRGPNRLRNGNTELYLTDVLRLDRLIP
jgi:hypothetical protein